MAYTDNNNISFTTFDGNTLSRIKKVGNEQYLGATVNDLEDIASDNNGKLPTVINAVEIDWNGAEWPSSTATEPRTINTTGDLINAIKYASQVGGGGTEPIVVNGGHYEFRYLNSQTKPNKPLTGSNANGTNWSVNATTPNFTIGEYTWMTYCFVDGSNNYGTWNDPIRITGENGLPGEDGNLVEFIYTRNNTGLVPDAPPQTQTADWYGTVNGVTWTDNPVGVEENNKYEFISTRTKENGTWSVYSTPALWSKWGEKGMDGDGYEYIYKNFSIEQNFENLNTNDNPNYWTANQTEDYLGPTGFEWSDNPVGITSFYKYEYVSTRKKVNGTWGKFSTPKIWAQHPGEYSGLTDEDVDNIINELIESGAIQNGSEGYEVVANPEVVILESTINNNEKNWSSETITFELYKDGIKQEHYYINSIISANGIDYEQNENGTITINGPSGSSRTAVMVIEISPDGNKKIIKTILCYFNDLGTFEENIKGDVKEEIAKTIGTSLGDSSITTIENVGNYIKSSTQKTSQLETKVNGFTENLSKVQQTSGEISLLVGHCNLLDNKYNSVYKGFYNQSAGYDYYEDGDTTFDNTIVGSDRLYWEKGVWEANKSNIEAGNTGEGYENYIRTNNRFISIHTSDNTLSDYLCNTYGKPKTVALRYAIPSDCLVKATIIVYRYSLSDYSNPNNCLDAIAYSEGDDIYNSGLVTVNLKEGFRYRFKVYFYSKDKAIGNSFANYINKMNPRFGVVLLNNSIIKQTADEIELKVKDAGINLDSKQIILNANTVRVKNGNTTSALFKDGKIKANYVESNTLLTTPSDSGVTVKIYDGIMDIFGPNGVLNWLFGVDSDGNGILSYYNRNGEKLYDLGPEGLLSMNITNTGSSVTQVSNFYSFGTSNIRTKDNHDKILFRSNRSTTLSDYSGIYKFNAHILNINGNISYSIDGINSSIDSSIVKQAHGAYVTQKFKDQLTAGTLLFSDTSDPLLFFTETGFFKNDNIGEINISEIKDLDLWRANYMLHSVLSVDPWTSWEFDDSKLEENEKIYYTNIYIILNGQAVTRTVYSYHLYDANGNIVS